MSYLSIALTRLSEQSNLTQADVGRLSGLTRSHLSRIFAAEQKAVTDQDFVALLQAFGKQTQAELVAARCLDARVGPGSELVEIQIKGGAATEKREIEVPQIHLSRETERAFAWLRGQCPVNPDLEQHLVGYAQLMGMK
jgi:transcriptional regulator with XRE-family HTH domain